MKRIIWLKVTTDKYELPLEIADTAIEMAEKCGVTESVVRGSASSYNTGRRQVTPFRSVKVDWDEE